MTYEHTRVQSAPRVRTPGAVCVRRLRPGCGEPETHSKVVPARRVNVIQLWRRGEWGEELLLVGKPHIGKKRSFASLKTGFLPSGFPTRCLFKAEAREEGTTIVDTSRSEDNPKRADRADSSNNRIYNRSEGHERPTKKTR